MSSSSSTRVYYDVFISFRGEDTRSGFISHLYDALTRKRIRAYKDDKSLEIGNLIAPELLQAIEASKFAIVVLSSNFATSKWCLEEIAKIVDCMELGKLFIIPVFYHVSPSDVRHQSSCFVQGFANHEENPEIPPQKVETWRAAFIKLGAISGLHVMQHRNESEVVSEIVKIILTNTQDTLPPSLPNGLVGIESRVDEVKRMMILESSEVRFIGICGMSGVGKTTLAEVVYDAIQKEFQESSFIENIKDISKEHDSDLCKFQQKLLDDILKGESVPVRSVKHGQTLLKTKLRDLKVIIVLDDVNHADQLTYLAGGCEWFGNGSRIIITTTNTDLLNPHKINSTFVCKELEDDEALSLFCQSAFEGHSTNGYEKLSNDIVKLASGLPLALNVYGSLLCGKDEKYWKQILKKLQEYPHKQVFGRLEIGYARLDKDQQDTFIYIACFLKGRDKDFVKDVLTNIGLYSECGITDLINKFLITFNHDDSVWMHDLLQQMCWEILRKESQRDYGKYIAIRRRQDVVDILSSKPKGMRSIEIINQESYKVEVDDCIDDPTCFSKMTKLKFLRISNIQFSQGLNYLSNDLRILEWYGCSLKSLPSTFAPKHIFELDMCYSRLETLWEKDLDLPNLRSINLSFSTNLIKFPDLTSSPNLLILNLEGCTKLKELHESILFLKRLKYMNLKGCGHLRSLGGCSMEMDALETLLLSGCSNVEHIPEFGQNMKHLEHLYVDGTNIRRLPESLGEMCNLRKLDVSETIIEEMPFSIHYLKKLRLLRVHRCLLLSTTRGFLYANLDTVSFIRELDLSYCNLVAVPDGIGLLCQLVNLDLSGNDFVSLPASISLLSNLRMLSLNDCKRLQALPKLSLVDVETDYGPRTRFSYFISGELLDMSKFYDRTNNSSPTVSCLNCLKLAENESGSYLAEKILNSYLQLQTNELITPEAVFKILGAGSDIPSGFVLPGSNDLKLKGPWIGVAICAVIDVHDMDVYMKTKYVVTAHIHIGKRDWRIVVPVDFMMAGLESQLVIYWTVVDDLQRNLDTSRKNNFGVSFSVEPAGDGNLQVTKFGVRIIRDHDILQLKRYEKSTNEAVHYLFRATVSLPTDLRWYICACEANLDSHSIFDDITSGIIKFVLNYDNQKRTLGDIQKVIECVLEINQEVLSRYKNEWKHTQLLPLVYEYYRISHGISKLCKDFVRLLKDISGSWLSVKMALEQIELKGRAGYYTYEEMLQQFNDLEAAKSVRFSDTFITLFAYICRQTVNFLRLLNKEIQSNDKVMVKLVHALAKVSSVAIAGVFSVVAVYMGDSEILQEMEDITSYSLWLHLIQRISSKSDRWFKMIQSKSDIWFETRRQYSTASYKRDFPIWELDGTVILLRELKKKFVRLSSASERNELMMTTIDKLDKNINDFSGTIEDINSHAHRYSHSIREIGITLTHLFTDSTSQLPVFGVLFESDDEMLKLKLYEDPITEEVSNLFRATLLSADLPLYVQDDEDDLSWIALSVRYKRENFGVLHHIRRIFTFLLEINVRSFQFFSFNDELVNDYFKIFLGTSKLYKDFVRLLKDIQGSWLSVKLALHQIRAHKHTHGDVLQQLNDLEATDTIRTAYNFVTSVASMCEKTVAILQHVNQEIEGNLKTKSVNRLATVSTLTLSGILSVMAVYMGDPKLFQQMNDLSCNSVLLPVTQRLSMRGDEWWKMEGRHLETSYDWELRIRDFYGNILVPELKNDMPSFIVELERKINDFSNIIEDLNKHAHEYACEAILLNSFSLRFPIPKQ